MPIHFLSIAIRQSIRRLLDKPHFKYQQVPSEALNDPTDGQVYVMKWLRRSTWRRASEMLEKGSLRPKHADAQTFLKKRWFDIAGTHQWYGTARSTFMCCKPNNHSRFKGTNQSKPHCAAQALNIIPLQAATPIAKFSHSATSIWWP